MIRLSPYRCRTPFYIFRANLSVLTLSPKPILISIYMYMDRLDQSKARNSNLENDNLTWTYRTADARGPMVERMLKSRASWPIFPLLTSLDNPHKHLDSPSSPPRPICPQPLWENRDVVEWHARTQVICHDTTVGGQRSHQKPKSHHHVLPRPRGLQLLLFQHRGTTSPGDTCRRQVKRKPTFSSPPSHVPYHSSQRIQIMRTIPADDLIRHGVMPIAHCPCGGPNGGASRRVLFVSQHCLHLLWFEQDRIPIGLLLYKNASTSTLPCHCKRATVSNTFCLVNSVASLLFLCVVWSCRGIR